MFKFPAPPLRKDLFILGGIALTSFRLFKYARAWQRIQSLQGQVVVITGASSGIGKAYAEFFARSGARLVLAARSKDKLHDLSALLRERYQTEVVVVPTDVANESEAQRLISQTQAHFQRLDILINNAGISGYAFVDKADTSQMRRIFEVNYWGMVYCTQAALPIMKQQSGGTIINIASTAGKIAVPAMSHYSASKHAMFGFSDALRNEVKKYGIQVLVIGPTSTKTDIVKNVDSHEAIKFNPDKIMGMSPERVARETLLALALGKREHMLGVGENLALQAKHFCPDLVDTGLRLGSKFAFKSD